MARNVVPVTFHLRPHLADFAHNLSGPDTFATTRDLIGQLALLCLQRRRMSVDRLRAQRREAMQFSKGRTPFVVKLQHSQARDYGRHVSPRDLRAFERMLNHLLLTMLDNHVAAHQHHHAKRLGAVVHFMERHGIAPDHRDAEDMLRRLNEMCERTLRTPKAPTPAGSAR